MIRWGQATLWFLVLVCSGACYWSFTEKLPHLLHWTRQVGTVVELIHVGEHVPGQFTKVSLNAVYEFPGSDGALHRANALWDPAVESTIGVERKLLVNPENDDEIELYWWPLTVVATPTALGILCLLSLYELRRRESRWRSTANYSFGRRQGF